MEYLTRRHHQALHQLSFLFSISCSLFSNSSQSTFFQVPSFSVQVFIFLISSPFVSFDGFIFLQINLSFTVNCISPLGISERGAPKWMAGRRNSLVAPKFGLQTLLSQLTKYHAASKSISGGVGFSFPAKRPPDVRAGPSQQRAFLSSHWEPYTHSCHLLSHCCYPSAIPAASLRGAPGVSMNKARR